MTLKRVIRVFPRRTRATPTDRLVRVNEGPLFWDEADEIHISVAFTWDLKRAEKLERAWRHVAPTKIGGPATGERGVAFKPGVYLKQGYVITSRGCPNKCWFCDVWKREGPVRELPIEDGWNVLDDNLLACGDRHIQEVFAMLGRMKADGHKIQFTGGLEAARLEPWHVNELWKLKPRQMFFAYDTEEDLEPLRTAGRLLLEAGWTRRAKRLRCYVLCGYPKDSFESATKRMEQVLEAGFVPMAMLYRDQKGTVDRDWQRFQRRWARPAISPRS